MRRRLAALSFVWLLPLACGRTEPVGVREALDAGEAEAGARDGGRLDAGPGDGGRCPPGFVLEGGRCQPVVAGLAGLRWELPCLMPWLQAPEYVCVTGADVSRAAQVTGLPGRLYDVEVRVRGVVETRAWAGGVPVAPFVVRGARSRAEPPESDAWNVYELRVSQPAETWALNAGTSGEYFCRAVDSTF
ncbi:MAG: hypothetical protein INH37_18180, partial [Myxococcaceae bacterium]|nr:hypothetical protein [Myxococcaceae bacterium]